jgi:hypothetical protein
VDTKSLRAQKVLVKDCKKNISYERVYKKDYMDKSIRTEFCPELKNN